MVCRKTEIVRHVGALFPLASAVVRGVRNWRSKMPDDRRAIFVLGILQASGPVGGVRPALCLAGLVGSRRADA